MFMTKFKHLSLLLAASLTFFLGSAGIAWADVSFKTPVGGAVFLLFLFVGFGTWKLLIFHAVILALFAILLGGFVHRRAIMRWFLILAILALLGLFVFVAVIPSLRSAKAPEFLFGVYFALVTYFSILATIAFLSSTVTKTIFPKIRTFQENFWKAQFKKSDGLSFIIPMVVILIAIVGWWIEFL